MWRRAISSFRENDDITKRERADLPVFTMDAAEKFRSEMPEVERVLSYFETKTRGKRMPRRSDIQPSELKDILPNVCMMSPVFADDGGLSDVVVQLMGTDIVSFYGEMTGKSIFDHPAPIVSERIFKSIQRCLANRAPLLVRVQSLSDEKSYLQVSVVYVPMAEDGETIDRFFLHTCVRRKAMGELSLH